MIVLAAVIALGCTAALADEEEGVFDEALQNFGYTAGAAWQCAPEAEQDQVNAQVLDAYNGIIHLFGSDRAFGFAAAFGAGTQATVLPEDCPAHLAALEEGLAAARRPAAEQSE